jgi:hypothetical protein
MAEQAKYQVRSMSTNQRWASVERSTIPSAIASLLDEWSSDLTATFTLTNPRSRFKLGWRKVGVK